MGSIDEEIYLPGEPTTPITHISFIVAYSKCPLCSMGDVALKKVHVHVQTLLEPVRQVEPYVEFVRWQCLLREEHHGGWSQPFSEVEA